VSDPARPIRWGILSTGAIAHKFAEGLRALDDAELAAVGSRRAETAEAFAQEFDVPRSHSSYADLAADPGVDVIYVATPHVFHRENTLLCLRAGKAVLCEKPFTINAREAEEVIAAARADRRFLMEAMWTRFLPAIVKVRELLAEGAIGQARMLRADFCFRTGWNPQGRLLNPALGGGALLDVGVYTVSLASMVFGPEPTHIVSHAHIGETGVDEQSAMVLGYAGGQLAVLACAVRTATPHVAQIVGTEGRIYIHHPFWHPSRITLEREGADPEEMELPYPGNGYTCEAAEVGRRLRQGELESPTIPLDETLAVLRILDRIRAQWGLRYPSE
jgi:predicted dehydrogenase